MVKVVQRDGWDRIVVSLGGIETTLSVIDAQLLLVRLGDAVDEINARMMERHQHRSRRP